MTIVSSKSQIMKSKYSFRHFSRHGQTRSNESALAIIKYVKRHHNLWKLCGWICFKKIPSYMICKQSV